MSRTRATLTVLAVAAALAGTARASGARPAGPVAAPQDEDPRPGGFDGSSAEVVLEKDVPVPDRAAVRAARVAAARWLVAHQEADGSFGSHRTARPVEVLSSPPGSQLAFRAGTTGLAVRALLQSPPVPGREAAVSRAVDWLLEHSDVRRQSGMEHYNVWGRAYGLRALADWVRAHPDDARAADARVFVQRLVDRLCASQCTDGGWGYLTLGGLVTEPQSFTGMSFTTATALLALDAARVAGASVPEGSVARARAMLLRCRMPGGAFSYGQLWNRNPVSGINLDAGAACRTPACQLALARWGRDLPRAERVDGLEDLLVRRAALQRLGLRRPMPHESLYAISGYFYLYGHAYAADLLAELDAPARRRLAPLLAQGVLRTVEPDGSAWDYPLYDYSRPYGTAYAALALARVEADLAGGAEGVEGAEDGDPAAGPGVSADG